MAIENLPLFSAMNTEEVRPPFHHQHPHLTSQEAHLHIMEKVNACIQEVNHFEQRVSADMRKFMDRSDTENQGFKEAIQAAHNAFLEAVQKEVNNFETSMSNDSTLFRNEFDARYASFTSAIEKEFTTLQTNVLKVSNEKIAEITELSTQLRRDYESFSNSVNLSYQSFVNTVNERMNNQDEKIAEYKDYMVDNLDESALLAMTAKIKDGSMADVMTELFGENRTFKGSLTYDEIVAVNNAQNGDYFYCTSDEKYYQYTGSDWVCIGSSNQIANQFSTFVDAFNDGSAFVKNSVAPHVLSTRTNLIDENTLSIDAYFWAVINGNSMQGTIPPKKFVTDKGETYYTGFRPNNLIVGNSYMFGVRYTGEGDFTPYRIGWFPVGSYWVATDFFNTEHENEKYFVFNATASEITLAISLIDTTITGEFEFFLYDISGAEEVVNSRVYTIDELSNPFVRTSYHAHKAATSERANVADKALEADMALEAAYSEKTGYASYPLVRFVGYRPFHSIVTLNENRLTYTGIDDERYYGVFINTKKAYEKMTVIIKSKTPLPTMHCSYLGESSSWVGNSYFIDTHESDGNYIGYGVIEALGSEHPWFGFTVAGGYEPGNTFEFDVFALEGDGYSYDDIKNVANGVGYYSLMEERKKVQNMIESLSYVDASILNGKKVLVLGDSLTAANKWFKVLTEKGAIVTRHARGGLGMTAIVAGSGGDHPALTVEDVYDKDFIIYYAGYNNRGTPDGNVGDCWVPEGGGQATIAGLTQFVINYLYNLLAGDDTHAANENCKILFVTPHCAGKYPYNDVDGYGEFPAGSGLTLETLANAIKMTANYNGIPVCDLWHESGINKFNWYINGTEANVSNDNYTKYELNQNGEVIGTEPLVYVNGQQYYQIRNGAVVLETYTGGAKYPYNGDQLHCSDTGYRRIGEKIYSAIREHWSV